MTASEAVPRPLRGRATELDVVLRTLRQARDGHAAMVVIQGEPGIGKSALVAAAIEQAARLGYTVGAAAAHAGDDIAPLASLGPALRTGTVPLIGSADFLRLASVIEQPLWLAEHVAALLEQRSTSSPLLIVLDDLHWADPLSGFVLRIVPSRLASVPIVWLLASRNVAAGPLELITSATADLPVRRIELGPLAADAMSAIAADRLGYPADPALVGALNDVGGNPFLAVQLVEGMLASVGADTGASQLPAGLRDGVRQRLALTSERCAALVRSGAVLGARFPLDDAAWLLGEPASALTAPLAEAIRAGLLDDDGTVVRFRHELLRRAVYEEVPPSARRATHRSVAQHLLASGRTPAEAAPHFMAIAEPGDPTTISVLRRAAHELLDTMAVTSVTLIRQAFALSNEDDPERTTIGREVVSVLVHARRYDEATAFAADLLRTGVSPDEAARIRLTLTARLWAAVYPGTELTYWLPEERDDQASPRLRARLAAYAALAGSPAAHAPALAEQVGDPAALAVVAFTAGFRAELVGEYHVARNRYGEAQTATRAAAGATGNPNAGHIGLREVILQAQSDDIDGARDQLADGATVNRLTDSWQAPGLAWARAYLDFGAGRLDDAVATARSALRLMDELHDHSAEVQVRYILGGVALLRGDPIEAQVQLTNAERNAGPMPLLRALLAVTDGKRGAAATLLGEIKAALLPPWREDLLVQAACAAVRDGDAATLRAASVALADLAARNPGVASVAGAAALAHGLGSGDLASAVALLRQAPRPLLLARAEAEYGRVALATGDLTGGVTALERAEQMFESCGASAPVAEVRRVLQAAGVRRPRRPATRRRPETGWAALTATERRVARLVANGHTNKSAAAELFLSPSTINSHLRAAFGKLGVNSRVQLAKVVLRTTEEAGG
ncbi:regulatory LuxR family protein [Micromonospora pisi]|uniref:Regulatory LuxR family protein n=1 Tax=Micromonospora pisi TaxID=589240 RepID=A0A495JFW9_9ACTN|nr:regulatory LuxR family protein [Micromonospora pisi]